MHHAHPFDLLWREETKLDLLDGAQRRLGVGKVNVRHGGDRSSDVDVILEETKAV